jgi:hypothetical protein
MKVRSLIIGLVASMACVLAIAPSSFASSSSPTGIVRVQQSGQVVNHVIPASLAAKINSGDWGGPSMDQLASAGIRPGMNPAGTGMTAPATVTPFTVRSVAGGPVILCVLDEALKISDPHKSKHEPRNVNVIATVECSQAVPEITLVVSLYRNGKRVNSTTHNAFEKKFIKGNSASGCKGTAGNYQGTATARVVFPPRYVPPVETGHVKSKVVRVNCWK